MRAQYWAGLLCGLLLLARSWAGTLSEDEQVLLSFKATIVNWNAFSGALGLSGWTPLSACASDDCLPVCRWTGVQCSPVNGSTRVTALSLPCLDCGAPAEGPLAPDLGQLQELQELTLTGNAFEGALPTAWGAAPGAFKSLQRLNLNRNRLNGSIPQGWVTSWAFPSLVGGNLLSGSVPAAWSAADSPLPRTVVLNLSSNRFNGTLPERMYGLLAMKIATLANNSFSGPIPPTWGVSADENSTGRITLQELYLGGNQLTGGLPAAWSRRFDSLQRLSLADMPGVGGTLPGAWLSESAFPSLQTLVLSDLGLRGTLPEWGGAGALPTLRELHLQTNNLTGSIPPSWAQLPSLQRVYLQPGNPGLCAAPPAGATFLLCVAGDPICHSPVDTSACGSSVGGGSGGGGGFPVAAVAAPVAVETLDAGGLETPPSVLILAEVEKSAGATDEEPACPSLKLAAARAVPGHGGSDGRSTLAAGGSWCLCLGAPSVLESEGEGTASGVSAASAAGTASTPPSLAAARAGSAVTASLDAASGLPNARSSAAGQQVLHSTPPGRFGEGFGGGAGAWEAMLPSDWEIKPNEIEILRRPDGTNWLVGAGAFGKVYKALRNGVQVVAVKLLAPHEELGGAAEAEFQREIAVLRACRDPNVGVCFLPGLGTGLVTEYMEGGSLSSNLKAKKARAQRRGGGGAGGESGRPRPLPRCGRGAAVSWSRRGKSIALDIARGLAFLHRWEGRARARLEGVGANILLTKEGRAKIGDVGLSKIAAKDYVTAVIGTLAWSAPEMLWGQRCTTKADIYSFGVVLWEICTQEQPVRGQLRDVRVPEECPKEVRDLILVCLEPDPGERPTAVQLVDRLQQAPAAAGPARGAGGRAASDEAARRAAAAAAAGPLPSQLMQYLSRRPSAPAPHLRRHVSMPSGPLQRRPATPAAPPLCAAEGPSSAAPPPAAKPPVQRAPSTLASPFQAFQAGASPSRTDSGDSEPPSCTLLATSAIYALSLLVGFDDLGAVCLNPVPVFYRLQLYRLATSAIFHAGILHLAMNMLAFVPIAASLERLPFDFMRQCAVGLSGVIFGLVVIDAQSSGAVGRSIFGLFSVPARAYPWVLLVVWQLLVPASSFLGHLCGVLMGQLYVWGHLRWAVPSAGTVARLERSPLFAPCYLRQGFIVHIGSSADALPANPFQPPPPPPPPGTRLGGGGGVGGGGVGGGSTPAAAQAGAQAVQRGPPPDPKAAAAAAAEARMLRAAAAAGSRSAPNLAGGGA
eukprot:scaffold1.g5875.t1